MDTDERRVYELGYHMVPTLSEEELQKELNSLRGAIKEVGGNFIMEGEPTMMDLAYTMYINEGGTNTGFDTAYFGWIKFDVAPEQLSHIEEEIIGGNKHILRHLLFKTVAEDTRAEIKLDQLTEVKSSETLAKAPKAETQESEQLSEDEKKKAAAKLDETLDKILEEGDESTETTDKTKED